MKTSVPRIRRARLKSGGAILYIFSNETSGELAASMSEETREIAKKRQEDMAGYVVISWSRRGDTSCSAAVADGRWVGMSELPSFIKTVLTGYLQQINQ